MCLLSIYEIDKLNVHIIAYFYTYYTSYLFYIKIFSYIFLARDVSIFKKLQETVINFKIPKWNSISIYFQT